MSKLYLPSEVLAKMVCLGCKNYLSFFPIYIKKDTTGAMCGRCKILNADDYIRDEAYEILAKFLLFPCIYKDNGCKEQLTPLNLENHEKCCEHRKYSCPSKSHSKCDWSGPRGDIIAHFQEKHPTLLMADSTFELDFNQSSEENLILFCFDEIFLVRKEVDSRKDIFFCTVEHLKANEDAESYDYFLKVESRDKNYFHKYPEKRTDGQDVTKLSNETLKEQLHEPATILVTLKVIQSIQAVSEDEAVNKNVEDVKKNPAINWEMLSELECPVCFEYMLPPIYQCLNGHSICKDCRAQIRECPMCKVAIEDTKNFSLEKMTKYLTYPCKFHKAGCNHAAKCNEIKNHEDSCEFGPYSCPLAEIATCDWKSNINKLIDHVENNHNNNILKSDRVDAPYRLSERQLHVYLIKFSKRIFKLHFKYENGKIFWAVQLVGPAVESKNYNFEIDLVDLSGNKRRCYLTTPVSPLTLESRPFDDPTKCLTLTSDFVDSFTKNNMVGFRVLVFTK